ncbi:MAG: DUF1273 domain-containing protein [Clostridia bacterium]|nr:DUF1273 domain-containing protein [Clostridia bacterium]
MLESGEKAATEFDNRLIKAICDLAESGVNIFFSGMAMGFDIISAEAVLYVRALRPDFNIKLIAAIPFENQSAGFGEKWKSRYDKVLSECDSVVLVSDRYYSGCYFARNKYMVDNSDVVVAYFDGKTGGTKNTLAYAEKLGRAIINLYDEET